MAALLIDVLRSQVRLKKFRVHDFVIMPDHLHLLLTLTDGISIERAMQLIKGNFSFRAKRELEFAGEVWQRGFSDVRIRDQRSFAVHRQYIHDNPVKAGLASLPEEYPYSFLYLRKAKKQGLKPESNEARGGTTKVVP
jgi:putative transposase